MTLLNLFAGRDVDSKRLAPMSRLALVVLSALVLSGCVFLQEPFPGWTVIDIRYEDVPGKVRTSFRDAFGDAKVTRVERSTFESRISGRPRKYRFFFEETGSATRRVIYDQSGKREDGFDFWFDRARRVPEKVAHRAGAVESPR